jgi:hypothetical protein
MDSEGNFQKQFIVSETLFTSKSIPQFHSTNQNLNEGINHSEVSSVIKDQIID